MNNATDRYRSERRRELLASGASIAVFLLVKIACDQAAHAIGIVTDGELDEPAVIEHHYYDEEFDSFTTTAGMFGFVAGAMLGWRAYRWVKAGRLAGDLTRRQSAAWSAWLVGAFVVTIAATGIDAVELPGALRYSVKIGVAVATYFAGKRWFDYRARSR